MASSPRTPRSEILAEKLLITRLITSVGLALLLLFAASAAEHRADATPGHPPVASSAAASTVTPGSVALAADAATADLGAASGPVLTETASSLGAHLGCLLGVLCGLAFLVVRRRWGGQAMPSLTGAPLRAPLRLSAPPLRRARGALSLSQLGLSRT